MRTRLIALGLASMLVLAACGGKGNSGSATTSATTRGYPADQATLTLSTVLDCLEKKGLDASKQSGLDDSDPPHIRVDYSGGNSLVYFYDTVKAAADDESSQAAAYGSYGKIRRAANVLIAEDSGQPTDVTTGLKDCAG